MLPHVPAVHREHRAHAEQTDRGGPELGEFTCVPAPLPPARGREARTNVRKDGPRPVEVPCPRPPRPNLRDSCIDSVRVKSETYQSRCCRAQRAFTPVCVGVPLAHRSPCEYRVLGLHGRANDKLYAGSFAMVVGVTRNKNGDVVQTGILHHNVVQEGVVAPAHVRGHSASIGNAYRMDCNRYTLTLEGNSRRSSSVKSDPCVHSSSRRAQPPWPKV